MAAPWRSEWLEFAKSMGEPPSLPTDDPVAMAQAFNAFMISAVPHLPPTDSGITTHDRNLSSACKVRIYTPPGARNRKLPLIFFIHGGGFFAGNLETEDYTCRTMCTDVPAIVMSVDFRTGWSLPVKHSVDDCFNAFQQAYADADSLGADPSKFIVCGGSAGAAIGTSMIYRSVKADHAGRIAGFVSLNGIHVHPDAVPEKYKHLMKSSEENSGPLPFVTKDMNIMRYEVLNMQPPNTDLELFPVAGGPEYLTGFPPTYIITSENDSMRDDGTVFAAELEDVCVRSQVYMFKGVAHYFWHFPLLEAGREFRIQLVEGIRWTLAQSCERI